VIVVVGHPQVRSDDGSFRPAGTVALVALDAAGAGASVQLLGKVGDDDPGDALLVRLAEAGVGHVALLRDASRATPVLPAGVADADVDVDAEVDADAVPDAVAGATHERADDPPPPAPESAAGLHPQLEAADVDLGLRYLTDFRVLVLAEPLADDIVRVAVDAARYTGAELLVVATADALPADVPPTAVVLAAPTADPEGAFARLLGQVAAAVDGGSSPSEALGSVTGRLGAVRSAVR
jgi:hypothetical protein